MTVKYPDGRTYREVKKEIKEKTGQKEIRTRVSGRANMGMQLETDVIRSCEVFRERGSASIYKRPTPIRIGKMDRENPNHITSAYLAEKSTTDFVGVYRSRYIDFECKETGHDTLQIQNIRPQQLSHLELVLRLGGIGFFLVCFTKRKEVYLLDASYVLERVLRERSNSGFKRDFFLEHGILVEQGYSPRLEILKAIDMAYFFTDS